MSSPTRFFPSGKIYHICNKSIAGYNIFRSKKLFNRYIITLNYYNNCNLKLSLSKALRKELQLDSILTRRLENIVHIIAYCLMPSHYHLLVKINYENQFSKYINNIENSYTRYYNKSNKRKGPLWQSCFKAIQIPNDATLLHVHRYIHLNPTTAHIVDKPEDWVWSSYRSYITSKWVLKTNYEISIKSIYRYKKFVENQINYQRTIGGIRSKLLDT